MADRHERLKVGVALRLKHERQIDLIKSQRSESPAVIADRDRKSHKRISDAKFVDLGREERHGKRLAAGDAHKAAPEPR